MIPNRRLMPIDYLKILRRRKWWFIFTSTPIILGVTLWSLWLPNIYRAETLILIEAQKVPSSYVESTVTSTVHERLRTITQQIKSHTRLELVSRELKLNRNLDSETVIPEEEFIKNLRNNIDVSVKGRDAFVVSFTGKEPDMVMRVTNRLASLFIEENLKVREQFVIGTTDFLERELERVRSVLEQQEKNISNYRQKFYQELPEHRNDNQNNIDRLQRQLETKQSMILRLREQKKSFMEQQASLQIIGSMTNDSAYSPINNDTVNNTPILSTNNLQHQISELNTTLKKLRLIYTDNYPDVRHIKSKIAELEARLQDIPEDSSLSPPNQSEEYYSVIADRLMSPNDIQKAYQSEINQLEFNIQELIQEQSSIRASIAYYEQMVANAASREQDLKVLTRDYEDTRYDYKSLLRRLMQAKVAENLEKQQQAEQFKVLDPARLPTVPWSPSRRKIILIGVLLGFGTASGIVYLKEFLDQTFSDSEELHLFTSLDVFASIPTIVTSLEIKRRRQKKLIFGSAAIITPLVFLAIVHIFWIRMDLLFAHTLQLINLELPGLN